jgi:TetR/AcrR family transcriptional repressor of nem operon
VTPLRDPEATRQQILQVAAQEIAENGFQKASLSDILENAGVSKGALYHHFKSKQALGYAVFDEVFAKEHFDQWRIIAGSDDDPINLLKQKFLELRNLSDEDIQLGCPVMNVCMEMTGVDEGFREKAVKLYSHLTDNIAQLLQRAQTSGQLKQDADPEAIALFLSASIQGMTAQAKYVRSVEVLKSSLSAIADYLESLRP